MSHILAHIIKRKLPIWNSRVLRYPDIPELCGALKVAFVEGPAKYKGEYKLHDGIPVIVVRYDLEQPMREWVAMHELGHHLLHFPSPHRFSRSVSTKADREANFFAAIALMPTVLCRQMTPEEIVEEFQYPKELIEMRLEISTHFQL